MNRLRYDAGGCKMGERKTAIITGGSRGIGRAIAVETGRQRL